MREVCTIAHFGSFAEAELAARGLHDRGIEIEQMSIITEGLYLEDRLTGFVSLKDKLARWCGWAALVGLLAGTTFYFWLFASYGYVGTLSSAMFEWAVYSLGSSLVFSGIVAILAIMQNWIAKSPARLRYRTTVGAESYSLLLRGTDAQIARARDYTRRSGLAVHGYD